MSYPGVELNTTAELLGLAIGVNTLQHALAVASLLSCSIRKAVTDSRPIPFSSIECIVLSRNSKIEMLMLFEA
jgi:hypothetical protein